MKLLACHVENYGNLSSFDLDFNKPLVEIYGQNGYGKTTLASFLKSMLYGLPKTTKDSTERERFYPFSGGTFGGWLKVQEGEDVYRIERTFDKKSPTKDSSKVFKNGEEIDSSFDAKNLLKIDREAFERTLFIRSDDVEISSTAGIREKLNEFADATTDENNFETAFKLLTDNRKKLKPDKGRNGEIGHLEDKEKALKKEIGELSRRADTLEKLYETSKGLDASIDKLTALKSSYSNIQTANVIDEIISKASTELQSIKEKYSGNIPSESELKFVAEKHGLVGKCNLDEQNLLKGLDKQRLVYLKNKFEGSNGTKTDESEIAKVKKAYDEVKSSEKELLLAEQAANTNNGYKKLSVIFITLGVLFLASPVLFAVNTYLGIAATAALGVCTALAAMIFFKKKKEFSSNTEKSNGIKTKQNEKNAYITDFLKKFSAENTPDPYASILDTEREFKEYLSSAGEMKAKEEKLKSISYAREEARDAVAVFCNKYGLTELDDRAIVRVENDIANANKLQAEIKEQSDKLEKYKSQNDSVGKAPTKSLEEIEEEIKLLSSRKASVESEISDIENDIEILEQKKSELTSTTEELEVVKNKCFLLEQAADALEKAEKKLCLRFVSPILNGYVFYTGLIQQALGENIWMNSDYSISFDRAGSMRSDIHLSDGQRCIAAFCLRLALTDNLFKGKTPFIIMDDPFISLDEENLEKIKTVVEKLSERFQIIYLYCHRDRSLKAND